VASIEFSSPDLDELDALDAELRGIAGLTVERIYAPPQPGEQGTLLDFLTVACEGGAITALLQIVKTLAESRGPRFSMRIRHGRDRLEVTCDNVEEVLPLVRKMLDGS
jgi:hypothetical protein